MPRVTAAPECKRCHRRTRKPDGYCYRHGPAGPHEYRATRIYSQAGCEDAGHKTRAALGFER
jgi:hypothetical protein